MQKTRGIIDASDRLPPKERGMTERRGGSAYQPSSGTTAEGVSVEVRGNESSAERQKTI